MKFVKRPIIIEAVQHTGENLEEVCEFLRTYIRKTGDDGIYIETLEGFMRADVGDWIIKGISGELYPCKPDIFALTYEEVKGP